MGKTSDQVPEDKLRLYEKAIDTVPDALLRRPEELGIYLAKSYVYTQSLPPKKSKKKGK